MKIRIFNNNHQPTNHHKQHLLLRILCKNGIYNFFTIPIHSVLLWIYIKNHENKRTFKTDILDVFEQTHNTACFIILCHYVKKRRSSEDDTVDSTIQYSSYWCEESQDKMRNTSEILNIESAQTCCAQIEDNPKKRKQHANTERFRFAPEK